MTEAEQYTNGTATEDEDAKVRPADIEAVSDAILFLSLFFTITMFRFNVFNSFTHSLI